MFEIMRRRQRYLWIAGLLALLGLALIGLQFSSANTYLSQDGIGALGLALSVALVITALFTWWTSQAAPHGYRYGLTILASLLFVSLVSGGFYALMSFVAGWELTPIGIAALLCVIALAMQSSLIFLRQAQELTLELRPESYDMTITRAILETLQPTVAARTCGVLVLVALLATGARAIQQPAAIFLVGTISEVYAALFLNGALLTVWREK